LPDTEEHQGKSNTYEFSTKDDNEVFIINLYGRSDPEGVPTPHSHYLQHDKAATNYTEPGAFPIGSWHNESSIGDQEWFVFTEDTVSIYSHRFANAEYSYNISSNQITFIFLKSLEADEATTTKRKIYENWNKD
jgi:hypothetical protein